MVIGVVRDPSGLWDLIHPRLDRCLPLNDLTCSDPTGTYKHLDQVQVTFELEPAQPADAFFSLLLFLCDHIDSYKRHKTLIDGFVHDPYVRVRSWLVAVVSLGTPGPVRPVRRLVERIEADLSDRIAANQGQVVLIDLADGVNQDRPQSDRIASAFKWCVTRTAEKRSAEFEYRLRLMQQLGTPLDFTSYFSVKESYSLFYQDLGLIDDALRQYDELDALLDTLPISSSGPGTTALDWASLLLSEDLVPLPSSSSPYDYLAFIFSRQIRLLFVMNRTDAVFDRTVRFIRNLKNFHLEIVPRTTQVVCIALSIARMFNDAATAALLSLALASFEHCGVMLDLVDFNLDSVAFLTPPISDHDLPDRIDFLKITPPELQAALESRDLYHNCYIAFAELVRRAFYHAGRRRFAASLSYRLGSLYFRRGHVDKAVQVFETGFATTTSSWGHCSFPDLIMSAQCRYLLKDIQMYIDTAFILFKIGSQHERARDQFRDQFLERMNDGTVAMFRRSASELFEIGALELQHDDPELHSASDTDLFCNEPFDFQLALRSVCRVDLAISSVVLVLECATAHERIESRQVLLRPGSNRFVFGGWKLTTPGDYRPISIQFLIHELALESPFDQSGWKPIRVRHRGPTATLNIGPVPDPLILGRVHAVPVRCQSNFDPMTDAQLSLQSISNPDLIQTDLITVVVDGVSSDVFLHNGQYALPDCRAHSGMDLILTVNPPADAVLHQDLSLTLSYLVHGVPVSTQAHTSLIFALPLSLTSYMETVLSRTFIQLIVHCVTPVPVRLHSYMFQPGPFSFQDLNPDLDQNLVSPSSSGYSFIFEVFDRTGPDRDIDDPDFLENFVFRGHFHVRCQPVAGILSDVDFPVNIQPLKRNPCFNIVTSCTSRAILGQPVPFSIRFDRPPQSSVSTPLAVTQDLVYDVVFDESSWRYAGMLHGNVSLQNGVVVISAVIVPIKCGYLTVPGVKLAQVADGNSVDIDPDQISAQFDTRQVLVLSRGRFAAGLRPQK